MQIRPTLIERVNGALPVPYAVSCLTVALLLGPVGFYIADLLSAYPDVTRGTRVFLDSSIDHYTLSELVGNNVIYPAIIFYTAFMLQYICRRIIKVEKELVEASPEWSGTIVNAFSGISRTGPSLTITVAIFVLSLPLVVFQVSNNTGFSQLYFLITYPLFFFSGGTFIWMYTRSLWGLYKIGTEPLKLKPYKEDPLLGLGGLGRISLTLTLVFLIAVFFATYEFSAFAGAMPVLLTISFSGLLVALGVSMFFLPLLNVHKRMVEERLALRAQNLTRIAGMASRNKGEEAGAEGLRTILILDQNMEQINLVHSWPFETTVIRSMAAIAFSVTASITAHLIIVFLGI